MVTCSPIVRYISHELNQPQIATNRGTNYQTLRSHADNSYTFAPVRSPGAIVLRVNTVAPLLCTSPACFLEKQIVPATAPWAQRVW